MSNFVGIIKRCEAARGAGSKQIIQSVLAEADETAKVLITAALDPYQVFGVKIYDQPKFFGNLPLDRAYQNFKTTLKGLACRDFTGDNARERVTTALSMFPEEDASYIARVIDKDLRIGASADSVNKAWGSKIIPTFEVMLADKCEEPEEFLERLTFPAQGDWKYDGCLSSTWTIQLKDGRTVTIGEFVDGGMSGEVLSYNVVAKKKEWKKVEARVKNSMPEQIYEWFRLTLEDGTVLPPLTGNHRIWLSVLECWRRVDKLRIDDFILSNEMRQLKISKIKKLEMVADRYDIQVADNENFFANGMLVHNCRTICIVRDSQPIEYRARSGKPMDHLIGTYDEDLSNMRATIGYDFVLDGESFASDFTETINAKKEGNQSAKDALLLRAFFLMPLTDWMAQKTTITMRQNRIALSKWLKSSACKRIEISKGREVMNYADMVAYCNAVIDVHKQEGLIIKNWDAVYQWDRTLDWCKVKRMWDVDARVVGFYMGRKKSRLEKTVGGITVEGCDERGRPFRCNVGSGFSDKDRDHIRDNWSLYEGSTAVVTYQEMTLAKGSIVNSLRFPVIKQLLRDDKVVAKLEI